MSWYFLSILADTNDWAKIEEGNFVTPDNIIFIVTFSDFSTFCDMTVGRYGTKQTDFPVEILS